MLISRLLSYGIDVLVIVFTLYLFFYYFNIFFVQKRGKILLVAGTAMFVAWQFVISGIIVLPAYINISITIIVTLLAIMFIYEGGLWRKCIFAITFNAIWMLLETLSGNILLVYCENFAEYHALMLAGAVTSDFFFLLVILTLKKVFTDDGIKELSTKYSIIFIVIPIGSIYIMNSIFTLGYKAEGVRANFQSAIAAVILLGINILVFYMYKKMAEDLQLRRMTSVYEQQLELCERHQHEMELSMLQLRDVKHNMRNNLVSIIAYAENGECEKIVDFINEVMGEGGIKASTITNSGNLVIDSLIGYWYVAAQKVGVDFSADVCIPMKMPFRGADICLILGNLLENAVEAVQKVDGEKYIGIRMKYDKNNLLLFVMNNYKSPLKKSKENTLLSTKRDAKNHGVGLPSVYRAVSKYHGVLTIDDSVPGQFLAKVVLYGERE